MKNLKTLKNLKKFPKNFSRDFAEFAKVCRLKFVGICKLKFAELVDRTEITRIFAASQNCNFPLAVDLPNKVFNSYDIISL